MVEMNNIETERFLLRKVTLNDNNDIFKILSDYDVVKYLNLDRVESINDANNLINDYLQENKLGNKYPFAIIDKNDNKFIGVFLIKLDLYDDDCFEFTVYIDKCYWGMGVYSEVLPEMIKFTFEKIETGNFRGFVKEGNIASAKVLLKNKFVLEKVFEVDTISNKIESYLMTKDFYYSNYKNK